MKHDVSSQREVAHALPRTGLARFFEVAKFGFLVVFCGPGACCINKDNQSQ